jgi:hypothetical protein
MDPITRRWCDDPAFQEGRTAAEAEIAAGRLGYRLLGKVDWGVCDDAAAVLQARFGIKLDVDGCCITPVGVAARAEGYNERMGEEIASRFGPGVIADVFREVARKHKKRRRRPG